MTASEWSRAARPLAIATTAGSPSSATAAAASPVVGATVVSGTRGVAPYLWCAVLSLGLIGWGVKDRRELLVNLGIAGFALTVAIYYFSDVMDRLGRSASLIGMGLLFLGGGYLLDRTRRRLLTRLQELS